MKASAYYLSFGRRVCTLRYAMGWGQKELASFMDTSQKVISDIEVGKRMLNAHEIVKLCDLFAVSADQLLGRDE